MRNDATCTCTPRRPPALPAITEGPTPTVIELPPLLVDAATAARMLSVSERTLYTLTQPRGPIPTVPLPGCPRVRRYSISWLESWIAAQVKAPAEK
jgi:hypothetical protein